MINKSDIVAIIPARGGSKGIPLKNIASLNGRPLLAYTIAAANEAAVTDQIFVSTDSGEITDVAIRFGAHVIDRPPQFALDQSSTESVLLHAIEFLKTSKGYRPDYILTLPPTSPLRTSETIRKFVEKFMELDQDFDAMLSLTESFADAWVKNEDGEFIRLFPQSSRRRQERSPLFIENSALYITKTESLIGTNSILGHRCAGFMISEREAIDINDPLDLQWAEFLLQKSETRQKILKV